MNPTAKSASSYGSGVFSKGREPGLATGVGTEEPGSLHFVSVSVSLFNLARKTSPLQAAVQLPVKDFSLPRDMRRPTVQLKNLFKRPYEK